MAVYDANAPSFADWLRSYPCTKDIYGNAGHAAHANSVRILECPIDGRSMEDIDIAAGQVITKIQVYPTRILRNNGLTCSEFVESGSQSDLYGRCIKHRWGCGAKGLCRVVRPG